MGEFTIAPPGGLSRPCDPWSSHGPAADLEPGSTQAGLRVSGADERLVTMDRATRYAADRRWPVDNSTVCYAVAVHQVRTSAADSGTRRAPLTPANAPLLETEELTILTAWAEGVSKAAA